MPTVSFDRIVFESLIGKKLKEDELKYKISMLGTDLEEITKDEINVEVFPNRPDFLSVQGFARAFSSFIGVKTGLRKYNVIDSKQKVIIDKDMKNVRPFTACAIIRNLKFDDDKIKEIIQLQEKLHITFGRNRKKVAIGIYPSEKIEYPIKFIAKKPKDIKFRPLESDRELDGLQILSQNKAGREYAHLLEGLSKFPLFVDNKNKVLSMPPIINSHELGKISEKTTEVFIECSGFDFHVLKQCLNIIVTTLADMGGEICSMDLVYGNKTYKTPELKPREMKISLDYVNKILGLGINEKQMKDCLLRMGFDYNKGKVLVPGYRADILHEIDFVEDIAIAYGYDNVAEEIPKVATIGEEAKIEVFKKKISEILVGLGLIETHTYNLVNKDHQTNLMNTDIKTIEVIDPVSKEHNTLRAWMIPSLLMVLKDNKHNSYPQEIFEIGWTFKKNPRFETNIEENFRLGVLLCKEDADYTKIRQVLDYLFSQLDMTSTFEEVEHSSFISGRVARAYVNKNAIAYIGEISPEVLVNWNLEVPVAAFELNITELFKEWSKL